MTLSQLGADVIRFDQIGGGLVNLDFYKRACELPGVGHVVLLGEGTFHQFHGGVTTGGVERRARAALLEDFQKQYEQLRGSAFEPPDSTPIYLGEIPSQLMRFVRVSSQDPAGQDRERDAATGLHSVRYLTEV